MAGRLPLGAQVRTRVGRSLMPDSSTKTINRPSRWAWFKRWPGAALPTAYSILVSLDGTLFGLLGTEAKRAQNAPDMALAEAHAVYALDERTHALERPQLGAKPMLGWTLQEGRTQAAQLRWVQLRRPTALGHCAQSINAALIKQCLPRVHGLACYANGQRHLGAALALLQHSPSAKPLLRCLAQSLLHHVHILQGASQNPARRASHLI